MKYQYVKDFEKKGLGLFVHFGLYSLLGKGEWAKNVFRIPTKEYVKLKDKFKVSKNWAKELIKTAKQAGCKYITLTTRHHEGFSLFDTCGLNDFDAPHSACGRDLVREFVDECRKNQIQPFFYMTLFDWYTDYADKDFPKNIDYLCDSLEILCKNYGEIGGFWFDGWWRYKTADWQEDRVYGLIRKYQPNAMIINNTGLGAQGKIGHEQIDSVTFERGKPIRVSEDGRYRAGEMCDALNVHWGHAKNDMAYKSIADLIYSLVDCRKYNCNMLLNVGPLGNGLIKPLEKEMIKEFGKWIKINKNFIYDVRGAEDVVAENADVLKDGKGNYYAVIKDVPMSSDPNVALGGIVKEIIVNKEICDAYWLDDGQPVDVYDKCKFKGKPFFLGACLNARVATFKVKE